MPTLISKPTRIEAAGNKPKIIQEFVGRVNSSTSALSVAHMTSPAGWVEPGQAPEFDEYTLVLEGDAASQTHKGRQGQKPASIDVQAGQAVISPMQANGCSYSTRPKAPNTSPSVFAGFFAKHSAPRFAISSARLAHFPISGFPFCQSPPQYHRGTEL